MRKAKIFLALVAVLILVGFSTLAVKSGATAHDIDFNAPKLQSTDAKLKDINIKYERLNTEFNKKASTDQKTINEQQEQLKKVQQEREDLQKQVQAKAAERQRIADAATNAANALTATQTAYAEPLPTPTPTPAPSYSYSGSHEDWMAAAGISPSDYSAVDYIVSHESGWRIDAYNPSGATGLCQALPAWKMASEGGDYLTNPVTQLRWCTGYAVGRYGGWWGAYNFWTNNQWW